MKSCAACHATYPSDYTHCPRDLTLLMEVGLWSEGTVVRGRYRILAQVGAGGMASVYKAQHTHFRELRALKVIKPELAADANFVRRFMEEAIITRRLQHPNAVRVDDIDQAEDGTPFIVMEFLEGKSLKAVMRAEGPMAVPRVCAIIKQVAAALGAAHDLGMVHRDIKPDNIALVGGALGSPAGGNRGAGLLPATPSLEHPIAKVLDFGIAKVKEGHLEDSRLASMSLTQTGMVVGTANYMSPEQAMGKRGEELDGRSDLYSLGVTMYEMLTGELPLQADSAFQMMMAQINLAPAPILSRRSDIPEAIATLVIRCLEKDRERRPASGQAMIDIIERWERGLPGQAPASTAEVPTMRVGPREPLTGPERPPISPPVLTPAWRSPRRLRVLAAIVGGVVIVTASVLGIRHRMSLDGHVTAPPATGAASSAAAPATPAVHTGVEPGPSNPSEDRTKPQPITSPAENIGAPKPAPADVGGSRRVRQKPSVTTPSGPTSSPPIPAIQADTTTGPRTQPRPAPSEPSRPVTSFLRLSQTFADGGDYDKAIAECQEGLQVYPGNSELLRCVSSAKEQMEKEKQVLTPR